MEIKMRPSSARSSYSMDNSFDFGYPVFASGGIGGYGVLEDERLVWLVASGRWSSPPRAATRARAPSWTTVCNYHRRWHFARGRHQPRARPRRDDQEPALIASVSASSTRARTPTPIITLSYTGEIWRNNPNATSRCSSATRLIAAGGGASVRPRVRLTSPTGLITSTATRSTT